jgi:pilus assembly protein Flp/PilA
MRNALTSFAKDEAGAAAIEYGLIAALVSIAGIVAMTLTGQALDVLLSMVASFIEMP